MTRAELRTLVLQWLDDPDAGYFSTSVVNTWLNLAQRRVQKRLLKAGQNFYEQPLETATVVNQADYVFPEKFMKLHRLELVQSGTGVNEVRLPIKEITLNQQDRVGNGPGLPAFYSISKNRMTLYPTPDQTWTLRCYVSLMVDDMASDSDEPNVPDEYQEYVAAVAAKNGFVKDDRAPQNLLDVIKDCEEEIDQTANSRAEDGPRMVRVTDEYDSGSEW